MSEGLCLMSLGAMGSVVTTVVILSWSLQNESYVTAELIFHASDDSMHTSIPSHCTPHVAYLCV